RIIKALDGRDGLRRRHPLRLVQDQPAVNRIAFLRACHLWSRIGSEAAWSADRLRNRDGALFTFLEAVEQPVDALAALEALVLAEADVGCELEIDRARHHPADEALVALQRGEYGLRIDAAEREHVDCREPQVGRHAHF